MKRLGLCGGCAEAREITSGRGSDFLRCGLSDRDPRYARYPRLPVMRCAGFSAATPLDALPPSAAPKAPEDPQG